MDLLASAGDGPPVLFLHGALVDRTLWDPVVALLPDRRCVVPTLPLGSQRAPVADRSALTPLGVADQIADLIAEQRLTDLTVVASDTGGALLQLLLTRRPEGISRVIFAPCDALEVFPPAIFCWPSGDRCFKVELGRRLAAQFRDARFVEVEDSYSFVSIDRPDALAALI